jgi:uncharacterized protein YciI
MKYKVTVYQERSRDYIVEASNEEDAEHLANSEYDTDEWFEDESEISEVTSAIEKLED